MGQNAGSNYWFALNGIWIGEKQLHIKFTDMRSNTKKAKGATLNWTSDDPNEEPIATQSWKLGVHFEVSQLRSNVI
jgi:hypothetical protein